MSKERDIIDDLVDELNPGISEDESSNENSGTTEDGGQQKPPLEGEILKKVEDKLEGWTLYVKRDDLYMWVHDRETDIVVVESPEGYDWWNIYDSTGECVEGVSRGPYDTLQDAIDELSKDLSGK